MAHEELSEWIEALASGVGPRRPTSPAEREAAELVASRLAAGLDAELSAFEGYPTFAAPVGVTAGLALAGSVLRMLGGRARALGTLFGVQAAALVAAEGGLVHTPLSNALSRHRSQNVVATVEPDGRTKRTLCLVCHLDTSRSGLLFHPRFAPFLNPWIAAQAGTVFTLAAAPLLERSRVGRSTVRLARASLAMGLALLAERELRGEDVGGANDNASGVAVAAELALEAARDPLESTRTVFLATGCEESGLLGMQAFLRSRDTTNWIFLNFDSLGMRRADIEVPNRFVDVDSWKR